MPADRGGQGRKKTTTAKAAGAGKAPAKRRPRPYKAPTIPAGRRLCFNRDADWDPTLLDRKGIREVYFASEFAIQDEHLEAISSRPELCAGLEVLRAGSQDTGNGGRVSEAAFLTLAPLLLSLRDLRLAAFNQLTGDILPHLAALPSLEHLLITGHDRSHGRISGKSLVGLLGFPKLVQMDLYDQSIGEKEGKVMSRMNGGVVVNTGDSVGDSMAAQMLDDGGPTLSYFNGKVSYQF